MNEWMKCGCRCRAMFTWLQTSPRYIIFSTKINQHASTVDCRLVVTSRWQINPQFIKCPEDNVLVSIMRCSAQSTLSACTLHMWITSLPTVYSILISQPTANITPLKQLFCTSTITSSVQWDHRKYHASAYSTSLLLSTLLTMASWSPVSHPGLVSMALFSAGSNLIWHLAAFV